MTLKLSKIVLNGSSRHRLSKGFILIRDGQPSIEVNLRDEIIKAVNQGLSQHNGLADFLVEARPAHPTLIGLWTPFLPVYDFSTRDQFLRRLAVATSYLVQAAKMKGCHLLAAGVNPEVSDGDQPTALCADVHQIEVYNDGEIERVYNLFRQFLPELLAVSAHSSLYGNKTQKDASVRMRVNPASFLPRYLSQFNTSYLAKIEKMMQKQYGLSDLRQMDISPLSGEVSKLTQGEQSLLDKKAAAVELRFIDAQCSYPFIRTQIILFQALAVYGRSLARQGKRLPYMRDEIIDENKALAIQGGAGAILKPDSRFNKDNTGVGFSFHHKGTPERASTALLMLMENLLLPILQSLDCQYSELMPIVLGATLRRQGKRCLVNYTEYQQYLYYSSQEHFPSMVQSQTEQLLTSPSLDMLNNYNHSTYNAIAREVEAAWTQKLTPRLRCKGIVKWYSVQKRVGQIRTENEQEVSVEQRDLEGISQLREGQLVTLEIVQQVNRFYAKCVRIDAQERHKGRVISFDKVAGIIECDGSQWTVYNSDILNSKILYPGDFVIFEKALRTDIGNRALRVCVQPRSRYQGKVKWFDPAKHFGYLVQEDNTEVFVHQNELLGVETLKQGQKVSFEIIPNSKGYKAIRVLITD